MPQAYSKEFWKILDFYSDIQELSHELMGFDLENWKLCICGKIVGEEKWSFILKSVKKHGENIFQDAENLKPTYSIIGIHLYIYITYLNP